MKIKSRCLTCKHYTPDQTDFAAGRLNPDRRIRFICQTQPTTIPPNDKNKKNYSYNYMIEHRIGCADNYEPIR